MKRFQRIHATARRRLIMLAACVAIPLLVTTIYLPGLQGPFVFDDLVNIVTNPAVAKPDASLDWVGEILDSGMAGPLGRPLAYLSFGFNYSLAGGFDQTWIFKTTNLIIHIVNAFLVWRFSNLLIAHLVNVGRIQNTEMIRTVPLLSAILFAVHPIQLTSVLYVVQRMTSLSAMFVLAGLIVFFRGRMILPSRQAHAFLLMGAGLVVGLLGLASKENAILIGPLAVVIEYTVFTRNHLSKEQRNRLGLFYMLTTGTPLLAATFWLAYDPAFLLNTYATRDFGPIERIFTESRILWFYLSLFALPRLSAFGLFHDDVSVSRTLFDPATTFLSIAAIVVLVMAAVRLRHRYPIFSLAVIWFFVGHSLESGIFGLELAHEHRNYVPSLGLALLTAYGIATVVTKLTRPGVTGIIVAGLVSMLCLTTFARAAYWSDEKELIYHTAANHPRSPSAQYMFGEYLLVRVPDPRAAIERFIMASQLMPAEPAYLLAMQRAATSLAHGVSDDQTVDFGKPPVGKSTKDSNSMTVPGASRYFQETDDEQKQIRLLLRPGISQEVSRLLSNKAAGPTAVSLLSALLTCVAESPAQCSYIAPEAAAWVLAAANNAYLAPVTRHNLLVHLANTQIAAKDYPAALRTAMTGIAHTPHDASYRILAADTLLFLNRCTEAQNQLRFVLGNEMASSEEKSTARDLLQKALRPDQCRDRPRSVFAPATSAGRTVSAALTDAPHG